MLHTTLLFLHIASVLWFIGGHGVAIAVGHLLPKERRLERIEAYLDLSRRVNMVTTGPGALLILATGVSLVEVGNWWGPAWPWLSLGLLILIAALAIGLVAPHYRRLRALVEREGRAGEASPEVRALLARRTPAYVGYGAFLAVLLILAMMVYKPF